MTSPFLDPLALGDDPDDRRPALDVAVDVGGPGGLDITALDHGEPQLAGLDLAASAHRRHGGRLSFGRRGLGPRAAPPSDPFHPRGRRAGDDQDRGDLPPLCHRHGSQDSLGECHGRPAHVPGRSRRIARRRLSWLPAGQGGWTTAGTLNAPTTASGPQFRGDAAADQPIAEPCATARQPALDRPDRPAQMPRRLLVGAALEVAEDHRRPVPLGEPVDLLVQQPLQLVRSRSGRASSSPPRPPRRSSRRRRAAVARAQDAVR